MKIKTTTKTVLHRVLINELCTVMKLILNKHKLSSACHSVWTGECKILPEHLNTRKFHITLSGRPVMFQFLFS